MRKKEERMRKKRIILFLNELLNTVVIPFYRMNYTRENHIHITD